MPRPRHTDSIQSSDDNQQQKLKENSNLPNNTAKINIFGQEEVVEVIPQLKIKRISKSNSDLSLEVNCYVIPSISEYDLRVGKQNKERGSLGLGKIQDLQNNASTSHIGIGKIFKQ